jgi:hypothetical protein
MARKPCATRRSSLAISYVLRKTLDLVAVGARTVQMFAQEVVCSVGLYTNDSSPGPAVNHGALHAFLSDDHSRLDHLLARAMTSERIDLVAYEEFRAGLLRHIAMEEKVLFVDARTRRDGSPLPIQTQLHADHAALASLLVPSPSHELLHTVRDILQEHNPLEEDAGGLYDTCERLAGADPEVVIARMHAIPSVRVSKHVDEPRIHEHIARMLAARVRP